ncbi:hypothetical protein GPECTOR_26g475 [Gonium pectorale]|uniref:FAS1 domain-containing protein n=1 Tax=Gonium pectorale TaxID=33097 RepID=A0A150GFF0_GONPE|nr:hypothetical protein GPECTOR_26g475 [Gonium pectorale]|eukprot:KXZ48572.1 hypothetical protein GPECTOR_26g475 [Gonium pectorale]
MALLATLVALAVCWPSAVVVVDAQAPSASSPKPGTRAAASAGAYICTDPDLTTLCRILRAAGREKGAARLNAFAKDARKVADELEVSSLEALYTKPKAADRLLQNLIIPDQAIGSRAFKDDRKFKSLLGQQLKFESALLTKQFYIESEEISALIIQTDIPAGRSVIHKTERVPVPDDFL